MALKKVLSPMLGTQSALISAISLLVAVIITVNVLGNYCKMEFRAFHKSSDLVLMATQ